MTGNRLGKNIRALREYYGETQEALGGRIHVEKNTVSCYETGRHEPSQDTLALIAAHFQITVEELLFSDLSGLKGERFSPTAEGLLSGLFGALFPRVSSKRALGAEGFRRVWEGHGAALERMKTAGTDMEAWSEALEGTLDSLFGYLDAWELEEAREETAANYIGLYLFWEAVLNRGEAHKTDTAFFSRLLAEGGSPLRDCLEDASPENAAPFYEELRGLLEDPEAEELRRKRREGLILLEGSARWRGLASYYVALRFLLGRGDNDLGPALNCTIGYELMKACADLGNPWAKRLLRFYP